VFDLQTLAQVGLPRENETNVYRDYFTLKVELELGSEIDAILLLFAFFFSIVGYFGQGCPYFIDLGGAELEQIFKQSAFWLLTHTYKAF
jgi:hypothetical protein